MSDSPRTILTPEELEKLRQVTPEKIERWSRQVRPDNLYERRN